MAILEKRKSVKQLPRFERYQDTRGGDRAAALRGETPITSAVRQLAGSSGYGPMGADQGFAPMSGATAAGSSGAPSGVTGATSGAIGAPSGVSKTPIGSSGSALTSALAGSPVKKTTSAVSALPKATTTAAAAKTAAAKTAAAKTSALPALTSKTATTAKPAITTATTKPITTATSVKPATSTVKPATSTLTNALTGALTGAALGVGTKAVIDKLTGLPVKPQVDPKKPIVDPKKEVSPITSTVVPKPVSPVVPKAVTPVVPKPVSPVVPKTGTPTGGTPKGGTPTGGGATAGTGAASSATGNVADDGTTGDINNTINAMQGTAYDDDGNLMPGYELNEDGDPVYVGFNEDTVVGGDGVAATDATTTGGLTRGLTGTTVNAADDTTADALAGSGYFTDAEGNVYDSEGNFVSYADGSTEASAEENNAVAYTDDYGNTYDNGGNLITEADHSDYVYTAEDGSTYDWNGNMIAEADHSDFTQQDADGNTYDWGGNLIAYADGTELNTDLNVDYNDYNDYNDYASNDYISDDDVGAKGGLAMAGGGDPTGQQDNGDGTITQYFDDGSTITYDAEDNVVGVTDATDTATTEEFTTPTSSLATPKRATLGPDYGPATYDSTTGVTSSKPFLGSSWPPGYVFNDDGSDTATLSSSEDGSTITIDSDGKIVYQTDADGNPYTGSAAENVAPITNTGGLSAAKLGKTSDQLAADAAAALKEGTVTKSTLDKLMSAVGGSGYLGAGAAGAVLGGLLGNTSLFSGESGNNNAGFDMSQVGAINPRTTDFGIGPANYVGYDQYGTPQEMPELYGNELYQNLNAPGFNEVNPGDYARMDAQMYGTPDETEETTAPDDEAVEGMADGGQPSGGLGGMQTFYTFGKPVDPMQNLYNPQPAQAPQGMPPAQNQQQMAQQAPPQGVPQNQTMMKPPMQQPMQAGGMRSGGLPAWSNVPVTQGRLNFRQGAAVHGAGDGQSDDIPAMLADGEYVIDADTVAQIGNGSTKAGAAALDKFRENIRMHKRSAPINQIPPKTKALTSYLKGAR